ncbi:MAG: hypothetical protein R2720_10015 [Candidatus Nanopelagicales bacterium]
MRWLVIPATVASTLLPSVVQADSYTIADEVGDISVGPEISDITSATVDYSTKRLRIQVTHASWRWEWRRYRSATGGRVTFGKGRSFVIIPNTRGRSSQLYTLKGFRHCPPGKKCSLPCSGWKYTIDRAGLSTGVSLPLRCFGFRKPQTRVKVRPFHVIPHVGQQPVIDPLETTPWIARG